MMNPRVHLSPLFERLHPPCPLGVGQLSPLVAQGHEGQRQQEIAFKSTARYRQRQLMLRIDCAIHRAAMESVLDFVRATY